MWKLVPVLMLVVFLTACPQVTNDPPENTAPNPPVYTYPSGEAELVEPANVVGYLIDIDFSTPPDPDAGDTVTMEIVAYYETNFPTDLSIVGELSPSVVDAMNARWSDPSTGELLVDGLVSLPSAPVGIEIRVVDDQGAASGTMILNLYVFGTGT